MHGSDLKVKNKTFQQDTTFLEEYLNDLHKLTLEEKEYLLKPVDLEELREIVKELENGKSPGSDGLTYGDLQEVGTSTLPPSSRCHKLHT